ncbi:transposase domain-containing protein [Streptomyces sp. NPDC005574]|uniref:transposase domain-containing protein n=1 Tax=Streptomyces sp. NPDC005574 TaxID=3156891 RepID=UPI0033B98ABB
MPEVEGGAGVGLAEWVSLGVLAEAVPRDVVDEVVLAQGRRSPRAGGKLPPHVMVYFAMALALFADDDYEEVMAKLAGTPRSWGCWDPAWSVPTSGGISSRPVPGWGSRCWRRSSRRSRGRWRSR